MKVIKKAINLFAGVSAFIVIYFLAFLLIAGVFHAEHWSFLIAFVPACIAGAVVLLNGEGNAK